MLIGLTNKKSRPTLSLVAKSPKWRQHYHVVIHFLVATLVTKEAQADDPTVCNLLVFLF